MLSKLYLLFVGLICICLCRNRACAESAENKIVGGSVTTINRVPYLVYLRKSGAFQCGGSLVSAQFVVTAGHCTYGENRSIFTVTGGTSYMNRGGITRNVARIMYHPKYRYSTRTYDVAVLKLSAGITGSNVRPIALCTNGLRAGAPLLVSGWGRTQENGDTSNRVKSVQLTTIAKTRCVSRYRGQESLTGSMMCTLSPGKDSCQGDSGGPGVNNGKLCAVVSWGYGCGRAEYPGVYTSISRTRPFIERAMRM